MGPFFAFVLVAALCLSREALATGDWTYIDLSTSSEVVMEGLSAELHLLIGNVSACSSLVLWPFVNGTQWGADIPVNSSCGATAYLPIPNMGASTVQVALLTAPYFDSMWTVGEALPRKYLLVLSNAIIVNGVKNPHLSTGAQKRSNSGVRFVMYWEPWFTPHNMNWGMSEAIPLVGRYSSIGLLGNSSKSIASRNVVKQHCLWFDLVGISAVGIDWTNNLWNDGSWADRGVYAQELINATYETLLVYASLRKAGYSVPEFVLLLGLDNGVRASIPALDGEVEWVTTNILDNPELSPLFIRDIGGKPLMVLFDGGNIHSTLPPLSAPQYSLRYMSSQFQENHLNKEGFYSWMDGTISPLPTPSSSNASLTEALTITNAFFADGGWLAPAARSTDNGATLVEESWVAVKTQPQLLFICQWNEYAGQATPSSTYVDIYNATFGNDMEPTSLTACGLVARPDNAYCGGWGFRFVNILRGLRHILDSSTSSSLLVVIQRPVPWLPMSRGDDLVVMFVTLGQCQGLSHFSLWIDNSTAPVIVPSESTGDAKYRVSLPAAKLSQLEDGWHQIHVAGYQTSKSLCRASVLLSDTSLSLDAGYTRDSVRFQLY
jgi:hypothetical protein